MARPFRIGATGGPGLLLQAGPITPTRRRDVPLSMCRWRSSVDDVLQRHRDSSQAEPTSTPEAIQDQQLSGGPSRSINVLGQLSPGRCHLPVRNTEVHRRGVPQDAYATSGGPPDESPLL